MTLAVRRIWPDRLLTEEAAGRRERALRPDVAAGSAGGLCKRRLAARPHVATVTANVAKG